jgi:hypothetical protein
MSNTVLRVIEVEVYDEKVNPLIGKTWPPIFLKL